MIRAIIVHGGAAAIPAEKAEAHRMGCLEAVEEGFRELEKGRAALDAVEVAVRLLEANPVFNAGFGSVLNAEGEVEMDAAIMDGRTLRAGAVAALRSVRHPVSVARKVMERSNAVLLVGEGARRFASEHCAELCTTESMITEEQRLAWAATGRSRAIGCDTVGAVALDSDGTIAAATSTGGLSGKLPGRVGDSPILGSGLYADEAGGCALTGDGESIMRLVLARRIIDFMGGGVDPHAAAEAAIALFRRRVPGEAGCVVLDRFGRFGWAHNSPNLAGAYFSSEMTHPEAFLEKEAAHA